MNLLNDILDLAKLEAGKTIYNLESKDLLQLVHTICSEMSAFADEKGLKIEVICREKQVVGTMDGDKIMQVIRNLLSNAIKFSHKKSLIQIELEQTIEKLNCKVLNYGVGIPEGELFSIFDKFVQSSQTKNGAGGTGLELAICMEIIHHHGGSIWAESEIDGRTQFRFEIPKQIFPV